MPYTAVVQDSSYSANETNTLLSPQQDLARSRERIYAALKGAGLNCSDLPAKELLEWWTYDPEAVLQHLNKDEPVGVGHYFTVVIEPVLKNASGAEACAQAKVILAATYPDDIRLELIGFIVQTMAEYHATYLPLLVKEGIVSTSILHKLLDQVLEELNFEESVPKESVRKLRTISALSLVNEENCDIGTSWLTTDYSDVPLRRRIDLERITRKVFRFISTNPHLAEEPVESIFHLALSLLPLTKTNSDAVKSIACKVDELLANEKLAYSLPIRAFLEFCDGQPSLRNRPQPRQLAPKCIDDDVYVDLLARQQRVEAVRAAIIHEVAPYIDTEQFELCTQCFPTYVKIPRQAEIDEEKYDSCISNIERLARGLESLRKLFPPSPDPQTCLDQFESELVSMYELESPDLSDELRRRYAAHDRKVVQSVLYPHCMTFKDVEFLVKVEDSSALVSLFKTRRDLLEQYWEKLPSVDADEVEVYYQSLQEIVEFDPHSAFSMLSKYLEACRDPNNESVPRDFLAYTNYVVETLLHCEQIDTDHLRELVLSSPAMHDLLRDDIDINIGAHFKLFLKLAYGMSRPVLASPAPLSKEASGASAPMQRSWPATLAEKDTVKIVPLARELAGVPLHGVRHEAVATAHRYVESFISQYLGPQIDVGRESFASRRLQLLASIADKKYALAQFSFDDCSSSQRSAVLKIEWSLVYIEKYLSGQLRLDQLVRKLWQVGIAQWQSKHEVELDKAQHFKVLVRSLFGSVGGAIQKHPKAFLTPLEVEPKHVATTFAPFLSLSKPKKRQSFPGFSQSSGGTTDQPQGWIHGKGKNTILPYDPALPPSNTTLGWVRTEGQPVRYPYLVTGVFDRYSKATCSWKQALLQGTKLGELFRKSSLVSEADTVYVDVLRSERQMIVPVLLDSFLSGLSPRGIESNRLTSLRDGTFRLEACDDLPLTFRCARPEANPQPSDASTYPANIKELLQGPLVHLTRRIAKRDQFPPAMKAALDEALSQASLLERCQVLNKYVASKIAYDLNVNRLPAYRENVYSRLSSKKGPDRLLQAILDSASNLPLNQKFDGVGQCSLRAHVQRILFAHAGIPSLLLDVYVFDPTSGEIRSDTFHTLHLALLPDTDGTVSWFPFEIGSPTSRTDDAVLLRVERPSFQNAPSILSEPLDVRFPAARTKQRGTVEVGSSLAVDWFISFLEETLSLRTLQPLSREELSAAISFIAERFGDHLLREQKSNSFSPTTLLRIWDALMSTSKREELAKVYWQTYTDQPQTYGLRVVGHLLQMAWERNVEGLLLSP